MAIMEQREHIATLCAAGTVGIAATGFALGIEDLSAYHITPGKRKWPGASSSKSPVMTQTPLVSRRSVSQPAVATNTITEDNQATRASSLFRVQTLRVARPSTAHLSDTTAESRGSSMNRASLLRPRTADTRSTSERRDISSGSSWLKRISTISSSHGSSPAPSILYQDTMLPQTPSDATTYAMPNKLVKRSTSQRALSNDQAKGSFLRRPITSHQRTATLREWESAKDTITSSPTSITAIGRVQIDPNNPPTWRPFFERGYPRKRHSTGAVRDTSCVRTVSTAHRGRPILVLGGSVEAHDTLEDRFNQSTPAVTVHSEPTNRQRLRRSLSSMHRASRRRFVTDPVVKVSNEVANGTISPAVKQSPLSPVSNVSTFDVHLPNDSPAFTSSPTFLPVRHRFSFRKRESHVPSDPTTVSSDNDTRVFTDDDSMDFQSDTAYDSLATRATASSHSAIQPPKLDTIFNHSDIPQSVDNSTMLEDLMQKTNLNDIRNRSVGIRTAQDQNYGIGISNIGDSDNEMDVSTEGTASLTPVKRVSVPTEELSATPVPTKPVFHTDRLQQSPDLLAQSDSGNYSTRQIQPSFDDTDNIDWSPMSDMSNGIRHAAGPSSAAQTLSMICSSPVLPRHENQVTFDDQTHGDKRASIFDWSEHQRVAGDLGNGGEARPKTVHGKQLTDNSRSRSSGRKGPSQLHLRSQSVPNNRESSVEPTPLSNSKFSTWGLGHKPVSEEWSDDFEFDDVEEDLEELPQPSAIVLDTSNKGSIRGVKVPQSIIDRQASVHIQFGQVQEFMLLVEELKRLRSRGSALDLLESHSRQLWNDAESIINLATINDEEDDLSDDIPRSPAASDIFGDEISSASHTGNSSMLSEDMNKPSTTQRSFSSPATPPYGRPRGQSLAQAKNFLQTIHQNRNNNESSPLASDDQPYRKLPFDTQDLKDLVLRSSVITRALKEIIRKAEGVSISPTKTPPRPRDPAFSQIFNAPDTSPCPPFRDTGYSRVGVQIPI